MNATSIIRSRGATPRIDEAGHLALDLARVPHDQRAEVVALAKRHKKAIIRELTGEPSSSPTSDEWECPTGYARHREFWTSEYGLRICSICHPQSVKEGATWKQ